jgi:hypothetical protein
MNKRTRRITIRFTPEEFAKLENLHGYQNSASLSDYIRKVALAKDLAEFQMIQEILEHVRQEKIQRETVEVV